jgi:hypothetical protein
LDQQKVLVEEAELELLVVMYLYLQEMLQQVEQDQQTVFQDHQ